eukprot:TRINITY_DN1900_c0_g1_i2.p1 TRINITY_DN1900_c0_g1~~TRINITY_DN1900_c0_g1_i2.p1  ORF type:complete len:373 (-),score=112.49 TRINITY_DN1900_c0_g1_i2:234-1352(-)
MTVSGQHDFKQVALEDGDDVSNEKVLNEGFPSREPSKTLKRWQAATYALMYAAMGLNAAITGPTLLMMADNVGVNEQEISMIFVTRGVMWAVGSLSAGRVFEVIRRRQHLVLVLVLFLTVLLDVSIPFITSYWLLLTVQGGIGFIMSHLDVGGNILVFQVWPDNANMYLQLLQFFWGAGASVMPFLVAAVLLTLPPRLHLIGAYGSLSLLLLASCAVPLFVPSPSEHLDAASETANVAPPSRRERFLRIIVITATSVYLLTYVGAEGSFGSWLFAYATEAAGFPKAEAAYSVSAFWCALTFGRIFSVPIAARVSHKRVLMADTAGVFIAIFLLLGAEIVGTIPQPLIWISAFIMGFSMASMFGTGEQLCISS